MFSLFRKNPLFLPFCRSSVSSQVRKFFISSQARKFSSSSSSPSQAHLRSVKVFVWWDANECEVPSGVSISKVAPSIMAAVRANGIMGDIYIQAYGEFYSRNGKFKEDDLHQLYSTGITHLTYAKKNESYKHVLADLEYWAFMNPPPAHLFLIFGNGDFSGILHRLRMCNYNILLACPGRAHVALCHATTIMWQWSSMLKGEDLIGKHFNYPSNDPFNSWYGNSNVPLENPFSPTFSQNAEIYKPSSDIKLSEASKSVSRQVMKILSLHPNGISIGDLRAELTKCDLPLGKRFYGYKFFSNFLVSIPHVQLEYLGESNFWVHLVPSMTSTVKNKQKDGITTKKPHNEGKNMDRSADGIPRISSSYVSSEGDASKSFQSRPSQGKPIGDYVDGKSSLPSFKESNVHQPPDVLQKISLYNEQVVDMACTLWSQVQLHIEDSKLSEVDQGASHFEEPKSSELRHYASHPLQLGWVNIKVSVWWDFNSCGVPSDISFLNVAPSIMGVLRANGFKGPIHIDAYGDVSQLSEIEQEALLLSGIVLHHIPGGKHNSHKWLMDWASQNPQPAHLFLISGCRDVGFYFRVQQLRMSNYNILLAWPKRGPFHVNEVATIVWQWSSMLKGKYLTGKYFNYPDWISMGQVRIEYPPGWYRNSNVPLEIPFSAAEEPTSSQNGEIHEPSSYIKLVEVPELISRHVREILTSYPNGISIEDLRLQVALICLTGGVGYVYEHEEFSNILISMPHVQLLYIGEGDFCVRLIASMTSAINNKQRVVKNEERGVNHSEMPVLLSTSSFWDDVESFVFTSKGSRLLSGSTSREHLAHKLQKYGPSFLMSLTRNYILQLVDLLIAEKKWLEESPSQAFPFRLTPSVQKSS